MKKMMIIAFVMLVCASVAMAQTYTKGTGITGIDKLGAHQNGGRGCVGCHAPHSGARGNGGTLTITSVYNPVTKKWSDQSATAGDSGNETLWGQDLGPVLGLGTIGTGNNHSFGVNMADAATKPRITTGIVYCLSCHDGNVAKGAMMTNQSFEQAAGLLPASYGSLIIPTLLGNDGGAAGNYENDHPIGPAANVGALGANTILPYLDLDAGKTKLVAKGGGAIGTVPAPYLTFLNNYGLPTVLGARGGAGFVVETTMNTASEAYVVCTTCHTPHSMYTATSSAANPIAGTGAGGVFPSYFFIAAPYNPGADTANGTKASSATQFCRQCHFSGAGGSNEASGINTVATAF